jgi:hypothetical protein
MLTMCNWISKLHVYERNLPELKKNKIILEAQVSLYRSPDINKPSYECLHAEYI